MRQNTAERLGEVAHIEFKCPAAGRTPYCKTRAPIMRAVEPLLWRHRGHKTQNVPSVGPENIFRLKRFTFQTIRPGVSQKKTRFFCSLLAGRRCAAARALPFSKVKCSERLAVAPWPGRPATLWEKQGRKDSARPTSMWRRYPAQRPVKSSGENTTSHSVVNNSYLHLGVFREGAFKGVLQWGYALIPARRTRWWQAPRRANIWSSTAAWVQSYADERCQSLGVVYPAYSFLYM